MKLLATWPKFYSPFSECQCWCQIPGFQPGAPPDVDDAAHTTQQTPDGDNAAQGFLRKLEMA